MQNNRITRLSALLLTVLCCLTLLPLTVTAGYYASDESGQTKPPAYLENFTVSTENVTVPEETTGVPTLTPDGNMTMIDDILQSGNFASVEAGAEVENKQFLTVQTKNGNYFYLVIDRSGNQENVYFMNLVDEADLLSLMQDGETTAPEMEPVTCTCAERCKLGAINKACEICQKVVGDCKGKEMLAEPETAPVPEPEPGEQEKGGSNLPLVLLVLLILLGGGVYVYFGYIKPSRGEPDRVEPDEFYFMDEEYVQEEDTAEDDPKDNG